MNRTNYLIIDFLYICTKNEIKLTRKKPQKRYADKKGK